MWTTLVQCRPQHPPTQVARRPHQKRKSQTSRHVQSAGQHYNVTENVGKPTGRSIKRLAAVKQVDHNLHLSQPLLRRAWKNMSPIHSPSSTKELIYLITQRRTSSSSSSTLRLRLEDSYKFEGDTLPDSIYGGAATSIKPFRIFLGEAASKKLLPSWWTPEKQTECEVFATSDESCNLNRAVEKQNIQRHYGHERMPMQLPILAEAVYDRGLTGQDGTGIRKRMARMARKEQGPSGEIVSWLDLNNMAPH